MSLATTFESGAAPAHPLAGFGLDMLARGAARLRGDRIAISETEGDCASVDYRELDRRVQAFGVQAIECGLRPGERMLVVGAAQIGVATAILGALGAGLEPVVAPAHLSPAAFAFLAQASGAAAIVGPSRYGALDVEGAMLEIAATASTVRVLGSLGPDISDGAVDFSLQGLRGVVAEGARPESRAEAPRVGLVLAPEQRAPRATFVAQADLVAYALDFASRLRVTAERPILSTLSPASLAGLVAGPLAALLAGASLTWIGPFDSRVFVETLDRLGPCHLVVPAAIAGDLASAGLLSRARLETLSFSARDAVPQRPGLAAGVCPVAILTCDEQGRLTIAVEAPLETGGGAAHPV